MAKLRPGQMAKSLREVKASIKKLERIQKNLRSEGYGYEALQLKDIITEMKLTFKYIIVKK